MLYTYTTHLKEAHLLQKKNTILQWALIILSATSTAGVLCVIFQLWPFVLSIISACFTAISLTLNLYSKGAQLGEKAEKHRSIANALWSIREAYISLLTDSITMTVDEIKRERDSLQNRVEGVYNNAPLTSKKAYRLAQEALKDEEEQYFSKEELDHLLQNHLRSDEK